LAILSTEWLARRTNNQQIKILPVKVSQTDLDWVNFSDITLDHSRTGMI
jgi:hypothetical protein